MADQITEAQMAFLKMCRLGDSESVKEALLKWDVDPHAKEEQFDGRSALHLAAGVGCRDHIAPRGAKKEEAFGGVILKSERPSGALFTNSGPPFFTVESRIEVLSLLGTSFH